MIHWSQPYAPEIEIFMHHRFTLEQQLAKELLWEFDHNAHLIKPLRAIVGEAVSHMWRFKREKIMDGVKEEKFLNLWRRFENAGRNLPNNALAVIRGLTGIIDTLSAEDCSDVIRLFGAIVEKSDMQSLIDEKKRARPEPPPAVGSGGTQKFEAEGGIWDKKKGQDRKVEPPSQQEKDDYFQGYKPHLTGAPPAHGIMVKEAADGSVVLKMDRTFGLPKGADVSGTTADSVFFVNKFGAIVHETDPLYQLLPLATLVFNLHHTMLEGALTLTLNNITRYSIGSYSTLLPLGTKHEAKNTIAEILQNYEDRVDNKRILIYYDRRGQIDGCYQFEASEKQDFQKIAAVGFHYWNTFRAFPIWPTKETIDKWLGSHGLAAKLAQLKEAGRDVYQEASTAKRTIK